MKYTSSCSQEARNKSQSRTPNQLISISLKFNTGAKLPPRVQRNPVLRYFDLKCRINYFFRFHLVLSLFGAACPHGRVTNSIPDSTEEESCIWAWCTLNTSRIKRLFVGVVRMLGKRDAGSGVVLDIKFS
ncbi:hypothetical protein AVEN_118576-1 [Araneus ventricosus]|uniref:Uncharacterized protein n=1 Tax=Araneus ventricosus TaxID=182803 RepID=A0A4Y2AYA3_ARAVE|nr:hypothetical protein AVEN_118576-1 [Araneus ventricosus]